MFWRMEWSRALRQKESYAFLIAWLFTLVLLGGLGQALPVATAYTNINATLVTVIGLVLPLFVLLTTSLKWANERESKRLRLLSTYPIAMSRIVFVRYSAFLAAQAIVITLAFSLASFLVDLSFEGWLTLWGYAIGLTAYAAGIGTLIGVAGRTRLRAVLFSFMFWVVMILLWPTLLVATLTWLPYGIQANAMVGLLYLNGFELLRVWVSAVSSAPDLFGAIYESFIGWLGQPLGAVSVVIAIGSVILFMLIGATFTLRQEGRHD
ncbi:ABC transporter permease [Exiguobacterium sp.]|uniref:ABC transporter permease n=1 Tax=Exiguobacterium sp. TaxID=44751 RepID=UPI00391B11C1